MFSTGQEGQSHCDTLLNIHQTKAHRLKEHANANTPYSTRARLYASDTVHVSSNRLLITRRISRRQLFSHTPI